MHETLLEILAEPGTRAPLRPEATGKSSPDIDEGWLVSDATARRYRIRGGIARFVDGEAYAGSFGLQWQRFREVQLDSATGRRHSQRRFDTELGWTESDLRGKWVLDAGCGAGRFAEVAAARGARLVALDVSAAVEAARATLAAFPSTDVVQGSVLEPPFRAGVFDFAYCIGVIQHTPDPEAAIARIVECVRPGGSFGFSIYARRPWTKLNGKYLVRPLTRRLADATLLRAIERSMPVLFPIADRVVRLPLLGRVARFAIPLAVYVERSDLSREQRFQEAILDTFDMLSPRYDSPMTWHEVERVLRRVGVREWEFRSRVPINVVGRR